MINKKISIITAVWGEAFAEKWLETSFLTYYAAGNIPYLIKKGYKVDLVTCGNAESKPVILKAIEINKVEGLNLKFVNINNILRFSPNYGVTLTKSYYAAVNSYGKESLERQFIFLNADFFISNNFLKNLEKRIALGQKAIMGYSLRTKEEVLPILKSYINKGKQLNISISETKMIEIFLNYKHPTVEGQIYKSDLFFSIQHQLYFPLSQQNMICYHILRSPLLISPTRIMKKPTGYFDFNCIFDMCPNAELNWLNSSTEGVILEIEDNNKENVCLRLEKVLDFRKRFEYFRAANNPLHKLNSIQPIYLTSKKNFYQDLPKKYANAFKEYEKAILEVPSFPFIDHHFWLTTKKLFIWQER